MASIYRKGDSKKIWIRFRGEDGKWKGQPTAYHWTNMGEVRQAKLLARRQSEIEALRPRGTSERLADWVMPWLVGRYGGGHTQTLTLYRRSWRSMTRYLALRNIETARQVQRSLATDYLEWRMKSAGRNTAIYDIKLLAMALDEAKARGQIVDNPLRRLGLKRDATKPKQIWTDKQIKKAAAHFQKNGPPGLRWVFFLGLYQACRLRQCEVPLSAIRLELGVIQWPGAKVKGGSGYTQPIDSRLVPILSGLMEEAKAAGQSTLCKIPWDASMQIRRELDAVRLKGISHHGLRATWITRAAEAGVPESQAMAFCHHSSREVHAVYRRLSAISIAHVPSLLELPCFSSPRGLLPSKRDSAEESSGSRRAARSPAAGRQTSSSDSPRKTRSRQPA